MGRGLTRTLVVGRITAGQAGWPTAQELDRRRVTYAHLLDRAEENRRRGDVDESLLCAHVAAQLAYHHHFGIWVDPRIESLTRELAKAIARDLHPSTWADPSPPGRERIIHLASVLKDVGGHTEVIRQWVAAIHGMQFDQYLISSELQDSTALGAAALAAVEAEAAGMALCPTGLSGSERARWIARRLLELKPDKLILHIDPADVFALAAIEAVRPHTPMEIYFYNHSDHTFSVGWELADRVLESRVEVVAHSICHRGIDPGRAVYVPLTIDAVTEPALDRASLDVPEDVTLSISAANFNKVVPDEHWNFGEMLGALLEAEPGHHHLLVGGGLRRHKWHLTRALARRPRDVRSRVRWLGTRADLAGLFGAADFLLDSAPLSGSTVRIQAMAAGLPIVATYHASNPLFSWTSALYDGYPLIAMTGEEAVRLARDLIHQPALRAEVGRKLAERHAAHFSPEVLRCRLETLLGSDDGPPPQQPPARDYDLKRLAGLSGPVAGAPALLRRARVWLGDPGVGPRDRILRKVDQAAAALHGVGRS